MKKTGCRKETVQKHPRRKRLSRREAKSWEDK